jgi:phosphoribosylformylglycinamidine cyclo-ligase
VLPATISPRASTWTRSRPAGVRLARPDGGDRRAEMLRTFNCGVGMIVVAEAAQADAVMAALTDAGEKPVKLGEVTARGADEAVTYRGKLAL